MSEIKILDFNLIKSPKYIHSYYESKSISHQIENVGSLDLFEWKFYQNPYNIINLPCALDEKNEVIAGSNFYGTLLKKYQGKILTTILPYEIYVNPNYQRRGIFKKLIGLGESQAEKDKIDVMLAFPNMKSKRGFESRGWNVVEHPIHYLIKIIPSIRLFRYLTNIKLPFVSQKSDGKNNFEFTGFVDNKDPNIVSGYWSKEYLEWRFNVLPQAKYIQVKTDTINTVARIGYRGKLKEVQILFIDDSKSSNVKKDIKYIIKQIRKIENPSIIGFPISEHHQLKKVMKKTGFFKVKSSTNFTYKVLNNELNKEMKFSLCGLDFHTY